MAMKYFVEVSGPQQDHNVFVRLWKGGLSSNWLFATRYTESRPCKNRSTKVRAQPRVWILTTPSMSRAYSIHSKSPPRPVIRLTQLPQPPTPLTLVTSKPRHPHFRCSHKAGRPSRVDLPNFH